MPGTKLTYFPFKALAEPIRMLLTYLGEDFEDYRFEREQWPSIKPSMPFGKVPVLEMDGMKLHQSTAICRYLGKKAKLAGNNDIESMYIDIAVDTVHDFRQAMANYWYESDEKSKAAKKEVVMKEVLPSYLSKLDEQVKANNGYLANSALSWGDIYFVGLWDYLSHMVGKDIGADYPNLKILHDKVTSVPKIKEWIDKRPASEL